MAYACFDVIVGCTVPGGAFSDPVSKEYLKAARSNNQEGYCQPYSGGHQRAAAWFGVAFSAFDETSYAMLRAIPHNGAPDLVEYPSLGIWDEPRRYEPLRLEPTDQEVAEAKAIVEALPAEIRTRLNEFGVYLVPSSS
jgi:hypothetical protein